MEETRTADHYCVKHASFGDYLAWQEQHPYKHNLRAGFNGADSHPEAIALARKGLDTEGLAALELASTYLPQIQDNLIDQRFKAIPSVEGAAVDIDAFLTGEPECMVTYEVADQTQIQPVTTIVVAVGILCMVSSKAIRERGSRVMALLQAIEYAGLTTEIWADSTTRGSSRSGQGELTGRIAVKLKSAGEAFDAGTLMYAMTHDSMHRTLNFNAKDYFPGRFGRAMNKQASYGGTALGAIKHPEDYPERAVYLPALESNSDTFNVENTLRLLGLLA